MTMIQSLPQELLDLIIDVVYASYGPLYLKPLSTVSRAWRPRSQSNIFRKLLLDCVMMKRIRAEASSVINVPETANVSQQPSVVFTHVRELHVAALRVTSPDDDGTDLEVLRLFTNVTSLRILNWDFREFYPHHVTHFLSHFGATVRTLKILDCYVNSEVLIFLTSMFPLTDNLEVDPQYPCRAATYRINNSDRPSRSVGFRGDLTFRFLSVQHEGFLAYVNENSMDLHSLATVFCVNNGELQRLFECQGDKLSLVGVHSLWKQDFVSLSSCTQLRTLTIHLLGSFKWDDPNWDALFTVTSPHLEEIEIYSFDSTTASDCPVGWEAIDDVLCRHHDRSYTNGVTNFRVNLHPTDVGSGISCSGLVEWVGKAWPRFMKKRSMILLFEHQGHSKHL